MTKITTYKPNEAYSALKSLIEANDKIMASGELMYAYNTTNPCIGYYDNGKWKLYFYKSKEYRFLTNIPHTELQGYDMLPWLGEVCIITKSMKDVMCWDLFNIEAVAPHSEGLGDWKEKIATLQRRYNRIILNFDNDKSGIKASEEVLKEFDLETLFIPEEKDLSGYIKKHGLENTRKLINEIINKENGKRSK